ncbi:MAG TPA: hypothetical protein PLD88_03845, partial [Candidatus Berkiella sp.]|nr:hypothetical protein [Candidatus Berkiella sp.]
MLHSFQNVRKKNKEQEDEVIQKLPEDIFNLLSKDVKAYLFGYFDFQSLRTADGVCKSWYTFLRENPAPWYLKITRNFPSLPLRQDLTGTEYRRGLISIYSVLLNKRSIVSPDGEGRSYLLRALEGSIENFIDAPLRKDTINRLYMVALASCYEVPLSYSFHNSRYCVLMIKVAIIFHNRGLLEH